MRLLVLLALGVFSLYGQTCVPSRMLPSGSVEGVLDQTSCRLSDDSAYAAYRLDLPNRGKIELELASEAGLALILRSESGAKLDSGVSIRRPIEAGSYTLLVNGTTPGQAGPYSVRSAFIGEPGMWCAGWPAIGLNQTITGTLGASDCRMPNGTHYEAYVLNTFGAGTLTVEATSSDFTPELIVRSSDGAALASGGGSRVLEVNRDARYQIVVHSSDNLGSYRIATTFQPSEVETCRPVATFAEPGGGSATITGESCITVIPGTSDLAYYNYYGLAVSEAGFADIAVSSTEFAPLLNLLDEAGNLLAADSDGGGTRISQIRMHLKPGNYTVRVFSPGSAGGAYQLTYGFTQSPPAACVPVTAAVNEPQMGRLSAESCRSSMGPAGLYGLTLATAGALEITLATSDFRGAVALRDAKDNLIVLSEDAQGFGVARLTADLPAGAYTVAAVSQSGAGAYQLTTSFTAREIPPCSYAQPLDLNGGYIQKLGLPSCRDANGQPADYYEFTLPSDSVVAAIMTSSEVDGYLTLTDASGSVLRRDDNRYGLEDPLIVQYLPAGTYRLEARAAASTVGGYYQVDLRTIPGERPAFCGPRGTLEMGGSVTGSVNFSGCDYIDATFANVHSFRLSNETAIDLHLHSGAFDAYLVLVDSFGNVLARDDDGGGNTDARIVDLLGPGTYYAIAKPSSGYVSAGAYALSLAAAQ